MRKDFKKLKIRRLISALILSSMFSCTIANSALAVVDWNPAVQQGNIIIDGDLEIKNSEGNFYKGNAGEKLSIKASGSETGNLILINSEFSNYDGTIEIDDVLYTDYNSALFNSGNITAKTLENTGGIAGLYDGQADLYGNLTLTNGGLSSADIKLDTLTLKGGEFDNESLIMGNALDVENGATFKNQEYGEVDVTNINNIGSIQNYGKIEVENLNNTGTIDGIIATPTIKQYGSMTIKNEGISTGTITQANFSLENAAFTNAQGASLELNNSLNIDKGSILENLGNISFFDNLVNGTIRNDGFINSAVNSSIMANMLINNGIINLNKATLEITNQVAPAVGGTINIIGPDESKIKINGSFSGNLNIGAVTQNSSLHLEQVEVLDGAIINLMKGSTITLDSTTSGADVTINNNDMIRGDIIVNNGDIVVQDLDITFSKESTKTSDSNNPYIKLTSENATMLIANSKVNMEDSSLIDGANLSIANNGVFNSLANGFKVTDMQTAGLINAMNGTIENYEINNIIIPNIINDNRAEFAVDITFDANSGLKYDTFGSGSTTIYGDETTKTGEIYIADWTLNGNLNDIYNSNIDGVELKIINGNIADGHEITFSATDKEFTTPIKNYKLMSIGNGAYSVNSTGYNPAAFRGQVTKVAQYQNQLMINDMLFNHTMLNQGFKGNDMVSNGPNRYASSSDLYAPYQYSRKDGGLWLKTYANFEKLNMNHGLNVGNNSYGSIIGADFGLKELNNGWTFMPTAYVGYNGANQYWKGTGAYQNGAQAGFLGTWYKDNFMLGALTFAGMYGNSMETPSGRDKTMNYFAGAATKAAYNYKITKDLALQPNLMFAYSHFGQENWHSSFGQMGMMSGALNGFNIAPGLNLIWEKDTFSAYATVQYMYNVSQYSDGRIGNTSMPDVEMDRGYLQYGVGINKNFTDRFSGYFQTVVRNVGRTGIGFMLGIDWKLGKEEVSIKKNLNSKKLPEQKKTEISLSSIR